MFMRRFLKKKKVVRAEAQPNKPTYRRNRTMTDRSSDPEVSERAKAHYLRRLRRRIGIVFVVVLGCIILGGIGVAQYSRSVVIVRGDSNVTKQLASDEYTKIFGAYYQRYPLERFRFITNYDRLLSTVQEERPEVEAIKPAGMERLGVSRYEITLRQPVASWSVEGDQYYVDADGVTFTHNYYAKPGVSVVDKSGASISDGSAIASSRLLSFVGRVISLSADAGVTISAIEIPPQSTRQIVVKGRGTPKVRMAIDREASTQVNDMAAALRYFSKGRRKDPTYIDVRVEGKAFYK